MRGAAHRERIDVYPGDSFFQIVTPTHIGISAEILEQSGKAKLSDISPTRAAPRCIWRLGGFPDIWPMGMISCHFDGRRDYSGILRSLRLSEIGPIAAMRNFSESISLRCRDILF